MVARFGVGGLGSARGRGRARERELPSTSLQTEGRLNTQRGLKRPLSLREEARLSIAIFPQVLHLSLCGVVTSPSLRG